MSLTVIVKIVALVLGFLCVQQCSTAPFQQKLTEQPAIRGSASTELLIEVAIPPHETAVSAAWPLDGQLGYYIVGIAHNLDVDRSVSFPVEVNRLVLFGHLDGHMGAVDAAEHPGEASDPEETCRMS